MMPGNTATATATNSPDKAGITIALIVAASTNNVIGKNNQLPWRLPNDLKFFKNTTWGFPVIMGRKTYEALGKPLPGRTNLVITRQHNWQAEGAIIIPGLQQAIAAAQETNARQIFITGGGHIFRQSMMIADIIYITRVHAVVDGDAFFPVIDEALWILISNKDFEADDKHAYAYSFQVWKKNEAGSIDKEYQSR